ncbi:Alpha-L-arabinofuranosidase B (ABFB) domain-containing protein [Streptomyces mirabilis]|uniref:Alpha-L-arabinofuranosidase B (ABFB) domain-containing protein n=1 Tax=Streptomyces mirabilis TaxID=68239 RepID=A0A1I2NYE2_9ACTN|nr:Alpha-L-arabinofuranosidase B (ABFB) domain-containing protein [Streptomyces mirabilis]
MFQRDDAAGVYGPGHNGFFTSPDGTENWIVYHANSSSGGGCGNGRTTRTQKFTWNADGTPNFGTPVADGVTPVRFSSYDFPDRYIRHWEFRAKIEPNVTNLADSQFRVVRGLAGTGTLSLESANYPGY